MKYDKGFLMKNCNKYNMKYTLIRYHYIKLLYPEVSIGNRLKYELNDVKIKVVCICVHATKLSLNILQKYLTWQI